MPFALPATRDGHPVQHTCENTPIRAGGEQIAALLRFRWNVISNE